MGFQEKVLSVNGIKDFLTFMIRNLLTGTNPIKLPKPVLRWIVENPLRYRQASNHYFSPYDAHRKDDLFVLRQMGSGKI